MPPMTRVSSPSTLIAYAFSDNVAVAGLRRPLASQIMNLDLLIFLMSTLASGAKASLNTALTLVLSPGSGMIQMKCALTAEAAMANTASASIQRFMTFSPTRQLAIHGIVVIIAR